MIDSTALSIAVVDWQRDRDSLYAIRHVVFVQEQQVPAEMEIDDEDLLATHFLVQYQGANVAAARLCRSGQVGRMAVLQPYRGMGIGAALLQAILDYARAAQLERLFLHAQLHAVPFYQRFGFHATGDTFMEAGIAHCEMERLEHG